MYIERKRRKIRENMHKMSDKKSMGALPLFVFRGERQLCVLTLIQEKKLTEEEMGFKKNAKTKFFKIALHYSRALPLADVRGWIMLW